MVKLIIISFNFQDNPRNYQLGLSLLDPASDEHPMPCACKLARCALYAALLQKEEEDLEDLEEHTSNDNDVKVADIS